MKYMGSKKWMLSNGLGDVLDVRAPHYHRFVDLFSGTGVVSWHVAERCAIPVLSVDLQSYAAVMAQAIIGRTRRLDPERLVSRWLKPARRAVTRYSGWAAASALAARPVTIRSVSEARGLCQDVGANRLVARSYGGYYFSPVQSLALDALTAHLPDREPDRSVCLATLIQTATRCAASPGHTAQPLSPSASALPFIEAAWARDPVAICAGLLPKLAARYGRRLGKATVADASDIAATLGPDDLVFLDPPYSAAQYSRFYHVLETIARGQCGEVSGDGRYPPPSERPRSVFSLKSEAGPAIVGLLESIGRVRSGVVMTFPQHACSNGVVGEELITVARQWFQVDVKAVATRYSTLGGNNEGRAARRRSLELILSMTPR